MWYFLQRNKTFHLILLLILLQLLFLVPLLDKGIHVTHDGENHLARFAAYKKAIFDGHFPPRWAGDLNYGYGIPVLNFFYPLPGYFATILSFMGISLETTLKILLALAFVLNPVGMFLFLSRYTIRSASFLGGLLYGLAPYQFLNIFVRGDIGESFALALIPFALFFFSKGVGDKNMRFVVLGGVCSALSILSHHGIGLMTFPFIFFLIVFIAYKKNSPIVSVLLFLCLWFGISAFFWIPALIEHKYTLSSLFIGTMYKEHFLTFPTVISNTWGFGANVNDAGGQSPQIGIIHFILLCYCLLRSRKKIRSAIAIISLLFFLISIFLVTDVSNQIWNSASLLQKYQFPWRFVALSSLTLPIIVGLIFPIRNHVVVLLLSILLVVTSFNYMKVSDYISHSDDWYSRFPGTTFYHGETLTIWSDGAASQYPKAPVEVIAGEAKLNLLEKKTQIVRLDVLATTKSTLRFNTLYYPGWRAQIDDVETDIQFQDPNSRGIITISVPEGSHKVTIKLTETKLRLFSNTITVIAILLATSILLLKVDVYKQIMPRYYAKQTI